MIETLLEVRNLSKTFRYRTGWFRRQTVEAVKPLSFTLREGQTLAIIGENGSGKSTLAKMLAGMIEPTSGELLIDDHPLHFGDYSFRSQRIRMIFQDPSTSLNPRQRISQILDFPLRLNTDLEPEQRRKQIIETMRMVGLLPDHVSYYPHMLAPGQKQRLGLILNPTDRTHVSPNILHNNLTFLFIYTNVHPQSYTRKNQTPPSHVLAG